MRRLPLVSCLALASMLSLPAATAAQETLVPGRNYLPKVDGSAARPPNTYGRETTLGSFRKAAGEEGFASGGVERWSYDASRIRTTIPVEFSTGPKVNAGSGSPESVVTAPTGSIWLRSDGGAGTSFYIKEAGAGSTGWQGITANTHAMLSATHTDSTAASVTRGDLVTGQGVSPTWQRLARGPLGSYLRSDGTDLAWTPYIDVAGGTVTASTPVFTATQTWNAGAETFTAIKLNVTDTASAAAALLMDLQVGGSSKFKVDKAGNTTNGGTLTVSGFGEHRFSASGTGGNFIKIENTTAGTGNYASLRIFNNAGTGLYLSAYSSTYTAGTYDQPNAVGFTNDGPGGISFAAIHASAPVRVYSGGTTETARFTTTQDFAIGAAKKFYIDGVAGTGNTYIWESSGDTISFVVGGTRRAYVDSSQAGIGADTWPTSASAANAVVADADVIRRSTSSRRYKTDIKAIALADARRVLMALTGVTYRGTNPRDGSRRWAGFIAEDVAVIEPMLATYDADGTPSYVTYDRLAAFMVPVVQQHDARIAALETQLKTLSRKQ